MGAMRPVHRAAPQSSQVRTFRWLALLLPAAVVLSIAGIVLGWVHAPVAVGTGGGSQLLALLRVALTSVTAATLLLGPGLAIRGLGSRASELPIGFVPIPGVVLLAVVGAVVWVSAGQVDTHSTSRVLLLLILVVLLLGSGHLPVPLAHGEPRVLGVTAIAFVIALGKSLWSLGPAGELYAGTISRTLEVGDRSDSRISYHVTTVVAHGYQPFSRPAAALFGHYSFSSRGPVPGILTTPVMLATGTTPTAAFPDQPWSVFDPQGFMVYRIVMMMLALTALLAVYTLTLRVAGEGVAWLAVLTVAGTPFFIHDVYFTWPKFLAAAQCLLAAYLVLQRRPILAGLFIGLGYLMHPVALFSVPPLLLLVMLVSFHVEGTRARLTRAATGLAGLAVGLGVVLVAFRLASGSHYSQGRFVDYVREADGAMPVTLSNWLHARWVSLLNTFVPLRLPLREANNPSINGFYHHSGTVVHFFFQYWTGLPFGGSIVFYPVLLLGLARMLRRRPVVIVCLGVVPLLVFAIYWGSFTSGLLREGMHTWVLTIMILWAMQFAPRFAQGRAVPGWIRVVLVLRTVDILVMMSVPTLDATHKLYAHAFQVGDAAAVALMLAGVSALAWVTARGTAASSTSTSPGGELAEVATPITEGSPQAPARRAGVDGLGRSTGENARRPLAEFWGAGAGRQRRVRPAGGL
jgi:hypothetical protein